MSKIRKYFIGDIIASNDDVFETARYTLLPSEKYIDKELKRNKNSKAE